MDIKDILANKGNIDIMAEVISKEEPRTFEKFGKSGRVCSAKIKDHTGEVTLTLWNDDVDRINVGDKIHIQNGWCAEYRGEKQLSSGKFGKIELVSGNSTETKSASSATPKTLKAAKPAQKKHGDEDDDDDDDELEDIE